MKHNALLCSWLIVFLIGAYLILTGKLDAFAGVSMTQTQVEAAAKAKWGSDARIRTTWIATKGTSWTRLYEVGVQEYQPAIALGSDVFGPEHALANLDAGRPLPQMTVKGSGSSWANAWAAVK